MVAIVMAVMFVPVMMVVGVAPLSRARQDRCAPRDDTWAAGATGGERTRASRRQWQVARDLRRRRRRSRRRPPVVVILYVARYVVSVRADTWLGAASTPAVVVVVVKGGHGGKGQTGWCGGEGGLASTLCVRQPRRSLSLKKMHTSETSSRVATMSDATRLRRASLNGSHSGIIEPVSTTCMHTHPANDLGRRSIGGPCTISAKYLGSRHRLAEAAEHEREGRCGVCHRVCAMDDHEAVVVVVVLGDLIVKRSAVWVRGRRGARLATWEAARAPGLRWSPTRTDRLSSNRAAGSIRSGRPPASPRGAARPSRP